MKQDLFPVSAEEKNILPQSNKIGLIAFIAVVLTLGEIIWGASTVVPGNMLFGDTLWRIITVIPGLVCNIIAWRIILKASRLYYAFPDKYQEESKLKIDQGRLLTIVASVFCIILIVRTMVIIFGRMAYS